MPLFWKSEEDVNVFITIAIITKFRAVCIETSDHVLIQKRNILKAS